MIRKIFLLFCLLVSFTLVKAQVVVSVEIDSAVILIGEQAHISLKVVAGENQKITFPVFPDKQIVAGLEVLNEEISEPKDTGNENQKQTTKVYTITSFDSTLYYIPPFRVRVDNKVYASQSLALKVETMEIDTLHLENFYGPKEIADVPFSWNEWKGIFYLSLLLIVLLLIVGYIYIQLYNNRPIIRKFRIRPALPPPQWAISEIEKINQKTEVHDDTKEYYTRLTDILRSYIQKRYGFNAQEMTSGEIIEHLTKQQDKTSIVELQELFQTADLVKFAKFRTLLNENDKNLLRAVDFIQATKLEVEEKPKEKVVVSPEIQRTRRSRLVLKLVNVAILIGCTVILYLIGKQIYFLFF